MDEFGIKRDKDIIFLDKDKRAKYYDKINELIKENPKLDRNDGYGKLFIVNLGKDGLQIETDKIDNMSNKKMLNVNMQYRLLNGKELQCINNLLGRKLVDDTISKNY